MGLKNQFRRVIQWDDPQEWEIFKKFVVSDEVKDASTLILQPGQGCLFTYEGKVKGVFDEAGKFELNTDNRPFITTLKKYMNFFVSDHKTGLWFYRTAEIVNIRWGTRIPVTYNDPLYGFPVNLRGYGNFSIKITQPEEFFTRIVAGQPIYYAYDLQELILSRIAQPLSQYLADAKFSYTEVSSNIAKIAADAAAKVKDDITRLGFELLDFRIEGSSFNDETNKRIAGISNVQADVKAAQIAGVSFEELQKMLALRDAAKNEGGQQAGIITALNLNQMTQGNNKPSEKPSVKERLKSLKELLDDGLLKEEEYELKKQELLREL